MPASPQQFTLEQSYLHSTSALTGTAQTISQEAEESLSFFGAIPRCGMEDLRQFEPIHLASIYG
jgi:hypothetical protein